MTEEDVLFERRPKLSTDSIDGIRVQIRDLMASLKTVSDVRAEKLRRYLSYLSLRGLDIDGSR